MAMQSAYPMPWEGRKKKTGVGSAYDVQAGMTPATGTGALPAPMPGPMTSNKGGGPIDEDPFNPFGPTPTPSPWDGPSMGGGYEAPPPVAPTPPFGASQPMADPFGGFDPSISGPFAPQEPVTAPAPAPTTAPTVPTYDSSQWDTDNYAAPGYIAQDFNPGAMLGWEQSNWDNANMQTPKYVIGRILSKYDPQGGLTPEALAEIQQAYPGATFDGKDMLNIPGVGMTDILVNAIKGQGGESWAWQDPGAGGAGGTGQSAGAGMMPVAGGSVPLPTITGASGASGGAAPAAGNQSWQDVLASIFNSNPSDILNNPAYLEQQQALDYQGQRERSRLMNQIAERNAAQGTGDSGAMAGEQNAASMGISEAQMGMQAQLATRALEQEQSRIMQALAMAQQYGTAQEQMALQERLAQLQASLQQQSINNQYALGQGNLGLGYYNANMGNQQFNDNLGWQMAQWQQQQNWLPWLFGMNGNA